MVPTLADRHRLVAKFDTTGQPDVVMANAVLLEERWQNTGINPSTPERNKVARTLPKSPSS